MRNPKYYFLVFTSCFLFGVNSLNAQNVYLKNDISFNASGSFYSTTHQKTINRETSYSFTGYFLFHLFPKLAIGPSIHYNYLATPEYGVDSKRWERQSFGFGPFMRYFILNKGIILPFISAGYHYSIVKYPVYKDKTTSHELNFGVGSEILLTDEILLDFALHYVKTYDKVTTSNQFYLPSGESDYSKIRFSFGFGIVL